MTDTEFDELCYRLIDNLGYEDDPKAFVLELVKRGARNLKLSPAEMIALGGADISEIANEGGSVTIQPGDPASRKQINAFVEGLGIDWRAGMNRALREWAAEEYVL